MSKLRKGQELTGHWRSSLDMPWFGHWDILELGEVGKDNKSEMVVTIKRVIKEEVKGSDGRTELCNVAQLDGNLKGWILNITNMKSVEKVAKSGIVEDWKDIDVTVFCDQIVDRKTKEIIDCIRVRPTAPKQEIPMKDVLAQITALVDKKLETKALEAELIKVWQANPRKKKDPVFANAIANARKKKEEDADGAA